MDPILKTYLLGCVIAGVLNLIFMMSAHIVKVSNILGYILNTALSWGMIATLLLNYIVSFLEKKHCNKVLWTSQAYKDMEAKAKKQQQSKHPSIVKK